MAVLYFSPKLREKLKIISKENGIATELLKLEAKEITPNLTFIDIDNTDNNYLTFIPFDRACVVIDNFYGYNGHFIFKNHLSIDASDNIWQNRNLRGVVPIFTEGRSKLRVGKLIRKIFELKYSVNEIENFVNIYKANVENIKEELKLVSSSDIRKWYRRHTHSEGYGTLSNSCMNDRDQYFDIYVKNPEVCRMLILTEDDKLLARALVWKLDKSKSGKEYYMDRVYSIDDFHVQKLVKYAREQKWLTYNSPEYGYFGKNDPEDYKMSVKVKKIKYDRYPYLDTFRRYDRKKGILYGDNCDRKGGIILNSTCGGYTKGISLIGKAWYDIGYFLRKIRNK